MSHHKVKHYLKNHWIYLFHALLLMLVLSPYLNPRSKEVGEVALLAGNTLIILMIIYAVSSTRRDMLIGTALAGPMVIAYWMPWLPFHLYIILSSALLLYLYAIAKTVHHLTRASDFGANEIFGATSVYILIGLTWALAYQIVEVCFPGAFIMTGEGGISHDIDWGDLLYYSFVTLTTLGYGDIAPVSPMARSLAILEAITGVIFVPVMISGFVSIFITHVWRRRRNKR